jgi:DNA-binding XRE family transcriptional regulator
LKAQKPKHADYPKELLTIGDRIRAKRLELGLLQKEVAKIIGVCEDTITYWETNRTKPNKKCMQLIVEFLGNETSLKS